MLEYGVWCCPAAGQAARNERQLIQVCGRKCSPTEEGIVGWRKRSPRNPLLHRRRDRIRWAVVARSGVDAEAGTENPARDTACGTPRSRRIGLSRFDLDAGAEL